MSTQLRSLHQLKIKLLFQLCNPLIRQLYLAQEMYSLTPWNKMSKHPHKRLNKFLNLPSLSSSKVKKIQLRSKLSKIAKITVPTSPWLLHPSPRTLPFNSTSNRHRSSPRSTLKKKLKASKELRIKLSPLLLPRVPLWRSRPCPPTWLFKKLPSKSWSRPASPPRRNKTKTINMMCRKITPCNHSQHVKPKTTTLSLRRPAQTRSSPRAKSKPRTPATTVLCGSKSCRHRLRKSKRSREWSQACIDFAYRWQCASPSIYKPMNNYKLWTK